MQKTDANTVLALIFLATAVMLIGGLAVIPALEEPAEARCELFKKNGDPCKDHKPKHNT
jgi:hypothetical protein